MRTEAQLIDGCTRALECFDATSSSGEGSPVLELFAEATRRWLTEHPADDGEAIKEDWLRSVGAKKVDLSWRNDQFSTHLPAFVFGDGRFGVWGHEAAWSMYLLNADGFDGQEEDITALRTRRDLRRLATALGITLKGDEPC